MPHGGAHFVPLTHATAHSYGPRATNKPEYSERASIRCDVKLASFAVPGNRKAPTQTDAEAHLSALCASALEASLLVEKYPKSAIDVFVLVLEADGPVLAASITAASLALADAGLEMRDLVSACSVACTALPDASVALLLDPNAAEMVVLSQARGALLTVAYMAHLNRVTQSALLQGALPVAHSQRALELAVDACKKLATAMREALVAGAKAKAEAAAAMAQ